MHKLISEIIKFYNPVEPFHPNCIGRPNLHYKL